MKSFLKKNLFIGSIVVVSVMPMITMAATTAETRNDSSAMDRLRGRLQPDRETVKEKFLDQARTQGEEFVQMILTQLASLEQRITQSTTLSPEAKEHILGNISEDRVFIQTEREKLSQAQSIDEMRVIFREVVTYMRQRRARGQEYRAQLQARFQENVARLQTETAKVTTHFRDISTTLKAKNVDTTALDASIDAYEDSVQALARVDVIKDPFALRGAAQDLRVKFRAMVNAVTAALQG